MWVTPSLKLDKLYSLWHILQQQGGSKVPIHLEGFERELQRQQPVGPRTNAA